MGRLKSARHHWWPVAISEHWKDSNGCVHWLLPDGEIKHLPPKNCGVIGNAHHIKFGKQLGEETVWDASFEEEFHRADDNFPGVVNWLDGLDRQDRTDSRIDDRFVAQSVTDEKLSLLVEGLTSLAVRSPRTRAIAVGVARHLRGPVQKRERNALIGLNIRGYHRMVCDSIGARGKFVIIYSPKREFIFGDGFFHNITSPSMAPRYPKIVAPLTPRISVLFAKPVSYLVEPRLVTLVLTPDEADSLNDTVQVYARRAVYYRTEAPVITDAYRQGRHLQYSTHDNPVDRMIHCVPGVPPRDTSLDMVFGPEWQ